MKLTALSSGSSTSQERILKSHAHGVRVPSVDEDRWGHDPGGDGGDFSCERSGVAAHGGRGVAANCAASGRTIFPKRGDDEEKSTFRRARASWSGPLTTGGGIRDCRSKGSGNGVDDVDSAGNIAGDGSARDPRLDVRTTADEVTRQSASKRLRDTFRESYEEKSPGFVGTTANGRKAGGVLFSPIGAEEVQDRRFTRPSTTGEVEGVTGWVDKPQWHTLRHESASKTHSAMAAAIENVRRNSYSGRGREDDSTLACAGWESARRRDSSPCGTRKGGISWRERGALGRRLVSREAVRQLEASERLHRLAETLTRKRENTRRRRDDIQQARVIHCCTRSGSRSLRVTNSASLKLS